MEEFRNIEWAGQKVRTQRETEDFYGINLSHKKSIHKADPLRCHLLEIHPAHLFDSESDSDDANEKPATNDTLNTIEDLALVDPRTGKKVYEPECDFSSSNTAIHKSLSQMFDERSQLTPIDQRKCWSVIDKLLMDWTDLSPIDKLKVDFYHSGQQKRELDKKSYHSRVQRHFDILTSRRCMSVHPGLEKFVIEKWQLSIIDVFRKFLHKWYRLQAGVPLNPTCSQGTTIVAKQIHVEDEGVVLRARKCIKQKFLRKTCQSLINWYEQHLEARSRDYMADQCLKIANEHRANVIIPLSSLCQLMDNASNSVSNWMMNFAIQIENEMDILQQRCLTTFGKPLPPTTLTGMEMNQIGFKYTIRASYCPRTEKVYRCKEREVVGNDHNPTEEIFAGENKSEAVEYKVEDFDKYLTNIYERHGELTRPNGNTSYAIWEMSEMGNETNGTLNSNGMRVLVSFKQDSFQKSLLEPMAFKNYSTKVEYQAEFGAEEMTKSELVREWCRQYFRPNSVTERVRVDVESGRILSSKQLNLDDIERDLLRLYQIQPNELLQTVWSLFRTIQRLPKGEYLLRHEVKHKNQVMIYAECEESTVTAIHLPTIYASLPLEQTDIKRPEWRPIDDLEVTTFHRTAQVLPCCFPNRIEASKLPEKQSQIHPEKRTRYKKIKPFSDRDDIVRSAQLHHEAKSQRITEFQKANRTAKRERNKKNRKVVRAKETALKNMYSEEHTLDPYMMFDPLGNVTMAGLVWTNMGDSSSRVVRDLWPTASTSKSTFEETTTINTASKSDAQIEMTPTNEHDLPSSNNQSCDISTDTTYTSSYTIGSEGSNIQVKNEHYEDKNRLAEAIVMDSHGHDDPNVNHGNVNAETIEVNPCIENITEAKGNLEEDKAINTKKRHRAPSTPTVTRSGRIVRPKVM